MNINNADELQQIRQGRGGGREKEREGKGAEREGEREQLVLCSPCGAAAMPAAK